MTPIIEWLSSSSCHQRRLFSYQGSATCEGLLFIWICVPITTFACCTSRAVEALNAKAFSDMIVSETHSLWLGTDTCHAFVGVTGGRIYCTNFWLVHDRFLLICLIFLHLCLIIFESNLSLLEIYGCHFTAAVSTSSSSFLGCLSRRSSPPQFTWLKVPNASHCD